MAEAGEELNVEAVDDVDKEMGGMDDEDDDLDEEVSTAQVGKPRNLTVSFGNYTLNVTFCGATYLTREEPTILL